MDNRDPFDPPKSLRLGYVDSNGYEPEFKDTFRWDLCANCVGALGEFMGLQK